MGGWRGVSVLVMLACFSAAANAETAAECKKRLVNEVDCFITNAKATHMLCSLSVKLALLDNTATEKARGCVADARGEMVDYYKAALARLSKNASGMALLKDTYATWQTSIGSLYPNPGELRLQYDARMGAQDRSLDEKLNRLDLDVPGPRAKTVDPKKGAADQKSKQDKMRACSAEATAQGLGGGERMKFVLNCMKG